MRAAAGLAAGRAPPEKHGAKLRQWFQHIPTNRAIANSATTEPTETISDSPGIRHPR
jgi:hypothetical protein